MSKRVLIGISGGIDSAVAAAILKTQGYEVIGIHFQFWDTNSESEFKSIGGSCFRYRDTQAAKQVCKELEIPLHVINARDEFQNEVLDYVVHETLQSKKPNPCVMCTSNIKLKDLLKKANEMKCEFVATGHFAKVVRNADGSETNLYRGVDKKQDQSFYLFSLSQEELSKVLTPLGDLLKANVRKMAITFNLPVPETEPVTQICFIDDESYQGLVKKKVSDRYLHPGPIVTQDGAMLGRHEGLYKYSLGQTKGLGLENKSEHRDSCVLGFDIKLNAIIVGPKELLKKTSYLVVKCNWVGMQDFSRGLKASAKTRHDQPELNCTVTLLADNSVIVDFDEPTQDVFPGQPIVFYQENMVAGGGWVEALAEPIVTKLRVRQGVSI